MNEVIQPIACLKNNTDIQLYAIKALYEVGIVDPSTVSNGIDHINENVSAIVHYDQARGEEIACIITYCKFFNETWIYLSFTEPKYRRMGYYRRTYEFLRDFIKANHPNIKYIKSGVSLKNTAMGEVALKTGRIMDSIVFMETL